MQVVVSIVDVIFICLERDGALQRKGALPRCTIKVIRYHKLVWPPCSGIFELCSLMEILAIALRRFAALIFFAVA